MKKSRFTESQIVAATKTQETGISVKKICQDMGICELMFFKMEGDVWFAT